MLAFVDTRPWPLVSEAEPVSFVDLIETWINVGWFEMCADLCDLDYLHDLYDLDRDVADLCTVT